MVLDPQMRLLGALFGLVFATAALRPAWSCPEPRAQATPCCCDQPDEPAGEQARIEPACCCIRSTDGSGAAASAPVAQPSVRDDRLGTVAVQVGSVLVPTPARELILPPPPPRSLSPPTLVAMHALLLC